MTNFDLLTPDFGALVDMAISAENKKNVETSEH